MGILVEPTIFWPNGICDMCVVVWVAPLAKWHRFHFILFPLQSCRHVHSPCQAYYRNARDCHPDKHPGDTVMRDKFQEAGTAKYSWKPIRVVMHGLEKTLFLQRCMYIYISIHLCINRFVCYLGMVVCDTLTHRIMFFFVHCIKVGESHVPLSDSWDLWDKHCTCFTVAVFCATWEGKFLLVSLRLDVWISSSYVWFFPVEWASLL